MRALGLTTSALSVRRGRNLLMVCWLQSKVLVGHTHRPEVHLEVRSLFMVYRKSQIAKNSRKISKKREMG
jgi:hypothetical protein